MCTPEKGKKVPETSHAAQRKLLQMEITVLLYKVVPTEVIFNVMTELGAGRQMLSALD